MIDKFCEMLKIQSRLAEPYYTKELEEDGFKPPIDEISMTLETIFRNS